MNDRLGELSSTLAKRNEEIATLSARWRMKYEALSKENETLKNRISKITSETTALPSQNDYENNQDQSWFLSSAEIILSAVSAAYIMIFSQPSVLCNAQQLKEPYFILNSFKNIILSRLAVFSSNIYPNRSITAAEAAHKPL